MDETIIISLGGSLIVPDGIDTEFLKNFKEVIIDQINKGKRFVVITGGGNTAREYIEGAKVFGVTNADELDWVGIASTRLNGELLRVAFGDMADEKIIMNPDLVHASAKPVLVGAGWQPGNSSDLAAVHVAKSLNAKKLINLSNIDYVYDKDPRKFSDAVKIENISWAEFRKILPENWNPGLSSPFDPIAAREAEKLGLEVVIMNGKNLPNVQKCIGGEEFLGTQIK